MRSSRIIGSTATCVYLLALLGAAIAPGSNPAPGDPPGNAPERTSKIPAKELGLTVMSNKFDHGGSSAAIHRQPKTPRIGFSINLHHTDYLPKYIKAIDEMVALGLNSLQILTPAFQEHGGSQTITLPVEPGRCPPASDILTLLGYAKHKGLRTALMPTVLFTHPRGNEWRGKISPPNWDRWWQSYEKTILHFATLAQQAHADLFCIGSELLSTERQTDRWQKLITQVRQQFEGELIYSTNWDHFHVPQFWNQLDHIGISGYWDMTTHTPNDTSPTQEQLNARWREIQDQILAFAKHQQKTILITELGYPTLSWALKSPWNYVHDAGQKPDPMPQTQGYEAFCRAWPRPLPSDMAGVFFYAWDPYHQGGPLDTGYGIRGKPALKILKNWLKTNQSSPSTAFTLE